MEDMAFYEYVVAQKGLKVTMKKVFLIVFYVLYVIGAPMSRRSYRMRSLPMRSM